MDDEDPLQGHELEDALAVDLLMGWDGTACATCGATLGTDPEDRLAGDAGLPICGDCHREASAGHLDTSTS